MEGSAVMELKPLLPQLAKEGTMAALSTGAPKMVYNKDVALLEIRKYPDRVLKQKASPVTNLGEDLQKLIDNMIQTMYAAPGIGLAAPQVGVSKRLAVIDISTKGTEMPLLVLINPVFLLKEGSIEFEEGCLSLPEYTAKVERAEKVVVRTLDRKGKEMEIEAEGLLAIALQHEIDHLDGFLLIDRISPIKREFFKKRYQKKIKSGK
jgi:peptide deformylase